MRTALAISILLVLAVRADDPKAETPQQLVEQLASDDGVVRDAAETKLIAIGEGALKALEAAADSKDKEVASRARGAIQRIRDNAELAGKIAALPKTFGKKTIVFTSGEIKGTGEFRTSIVDGEVVLEDSIDLTWKGRKLSLAIKETCVQNRYLSPKTIESKGTGDDELKTYTASFSGDEATVSEAGKTTVSKTSAKLVSTFALFRVVSLLPQRDGETFEFDSFEAEELLIKPGSKLTCGAEEEIEVKGAIVKAWRWTMTNPESDEVVYWVKEGVLLRALFDGQKTWDFGD